MVLQLHRDEQPIVPAVSRRLRRRHHPPARLRPQRLAAQAEAASEIRPVGHRVGAIHLQ